MKNQEIPVYIKKEEETIPPIIPLEVYNQDKVEIGGSKKYEEGLLSIEGLSGKGETIKGMVENTFKDAL